ncbi:Ankyrin repeat protein [Giardia duodenalis]|uniref:Ankyrin repeat protein n=1 Tax=Giardia intestinalis TaxID=5741 RepID=V6TTU8_GIAIN|nr:Ankyrin repeat protein [Giardia intestinalis]
MAPETLTNGMTSHASDVWALGIIIYELAALKKPLFWRGQDPKDVFVPGWKPDLSAITSDFIRETLEKQYKNLSKIVEQHQKQFAKVNEDLKQQLAQEPKAIPNSSNIKLIKLNQAHRGATTQQYSFIPVQDSSWTPLMCAAFNGDIETTKRHLVDTDKKNSDGDTALMIAAKAGRADVVELLDSTDKNGVTAFMRAVIERNTEMVKLLAPLQKEMKDKDGNTALILATRAEHGDIVELVDPTDNKGITALMRAAERNNAEAVRVLIPLQKGRTAGYVRINGWVIFHGTALMRAVARGHIKVVELLVEHESGMQDSEGWTAPMRAAENNHSDCVSLLVDKEARKQNKYGSTALNIAMQQGHNEIVAILLNY